MCKSVKWEIVIPKDRVYKMPKKILDYFKAKPGDIMYFAKTDGGISISINSHSFILKSE